MVYIHWDPYQCYKVCALSRDSPCVIYRRKLGHLCRCPCTLTVIFHKVQTKLYQAIEPFSTSCKSFHVCWQWFFTKSRPDYSKPSYPFLPIVTPSLSSLYYSSLLSNSLLNLLFLFTCCNHWKNIVLLLPAGFLLVFPPSNVISSPLDSMQFFFHFSAHWWFCPQPFSLSSSSLLLYDRCTATVSLDTWH